MPVELDPSLLDDVVAELDLEELETLDRLKLAVRLFFDDLENWLRRLAGDEDSWLHRLADLIGEARHFEAGWNALDFLITALPILAFLTALAAGAYYYWRSRRQAPRTALDGLHLQPAGAEDTPDIEQLPAREQLPALFRQVCVALTRRGELRLEASLTNTAAARSARVAPTARAALTRLARAVDRTIFGAWEPSPSELAELRRCAAPFLRPRGDTS